MNINYLWLAFILGYVISNLSQKKIWEMNINRVWLAFILGNVKCNLSPKQSWKWISIVYDLHLPWVKFYLFSGLLWLQSHSWTVRIRTMKYIEHDDWSPMWLSMPTFNTDDDGVTLDQLSVCYFHNHKIKTLHHPKSNHAFYS